MNAQVNEIIPSTTTATTLTTTLTTPLHTTAFLQTATVKYYNIYTHSKSTLHTAKIHCPFSDHGIFYFSAFQSFGGTIAAIRELLPLRLPERNDASENGCIQCNIQNNIQSCLRMQSHVRARTTNMAYSIVVQ